MNKASQKPFNMIISTKADWGIPAALIALTAIPVVAGIVRLVILSVGAQITPENARFFAAPVPVVLHILSVTLFCVLGAFQFAPGFRRRRLNWHRAAERIVVVSGIVSALTGLWMTHFYPLHTNLLQGNLLYGFRMLIGSAMIICIAFSWAAIMRREIARHRAWMIRGYAIAQGAGTQRCSLARWWNFLA